MTESLSAKMNSRHMAINGYSDANFDPDKFQAKVTSMARRIMELREHYPEIEALAACGNSGLMMMGALSYVTGLPQIAVRKVYDGAHDRQMVNGWIGCKGYLVIDDFVSSGETVDKIVKRISEEFASKHQDWMSDGDSSKSFGRDEGPKPVAVLCYASHAQYELGVEVENKPLNIPCYSYSADGTELGYDLKRTPARCRGDRKREDLQTTPMHAVTPGTRVTVTKSMPKSRETDRVYRIEKRRWDDPPETYGGYDWSTGLKMGMMNVVWGRGASRRRVWIEDLSKPLPTGPDPPLESGCDALRYMMYMRWDGSCTTKCS